MASNAICDPCNEDDKNVPAISWCSDCEESFCLACGDSHKRMKKSKNHHLVDIKLLTLEGQSTFFNDKFCREHEGLIIDLFCSSHDELCCRSCMTSKHRHCENILPLEVASKNVKKSEIFTSITDGLQSMSNVTQQMKKKQEKNKEEIKSEESLIRMEIAKTKQRVIVELEKFEKETITKLSKRKVEALSEIANESKDIENLNTSIKEEMGEAEFIKDHESDNQTFIFSKKAHIEINSMEEKLTKLISRSKHCSIMFEDKSGSVLSAVKDIGVISLSSKRQNISFTPHRQRQAQALVPILQPPLKFQFRNELYTKQESDVYGMTVISDKHLLICNYNDKRLVKCTFDGNIVQEHHIQCNPFGVALIPGTDSVVVTVLVSKLMQFVNINSLESYRTIQLPGEGGGISASSEKIVIGGLKVLYIFDTTGQHLKTIDVNTKFSFALQNVHITTTAILYTDTELVYCVSSDGRELWKYSKPDLKGPQGITTDEQGNVYIAYQNSNSVVRLSCDGKLQEIMLCEKDRIKDPWAICFSAGFTHLFVSKKLYPTRSICAYNIISK